MISKNKKLFSIITVIIIGFIILFVVNLYQNGNVDKNPSSSGVKTISSIEFNKLAENPDTFVVDVHIPEQTHIPGTDAFIPYDDISNNLDKFPKDKNTPLLVYCRSGSMSKTATTELIGLGYTNVYDLSGGINAYKDSNVSVAITPDQIDLGTVIYGDVEKTTFTLTNFTKDPLEIVRVLTSCGCTSAEVVKTNLEPYESTDLNVSFDPAVHKDDTDLGELTRTIYVDTDNPNFKQVTASIKANVIKK